MWLNRQLIFSKFFGHLLHESMCVCKCVCACVCACVSVCLCVWYVCVCGGGCYVNAHVVVRGKFPFFLQESFKTWSLTGLELTKYTRLVGQ